MAVGRGDPSLSIAAGGHSTPNADLAPPVDQGSAGPGVAQNDQLGTLIRSENIARLIPNLRRDAGPAPAWAGSPAVLAVPGLGAAPRRVGVLGVPASAVEAGRPPDRGAVPKITKETQLGPGRP